MTEATAEPRRIRAEHNTAQAVGQKILLLPLRERQLTGVKVRRRRHRRRRRLRLAAAEGGRKQAERTEDRTASEEGRRVFARFLRVRFAVWAAEGVWTHTERERERERERDGG